MKKLFLIALCVAMLVIFTGCFEKPTNNSGDISGEKTEPTNIEENKNEVALKAIREALKDEEFINKNLRLQKNCFGEEIGSGDQEITFAKFGEDKAIVKAYSYESDTFGTALTVVYYKDGQVLTAGNPSVEEPYHPGHSGFSVDFDNEKILVHYMHMGYYANTLYKYEDGVFVLVSNYEWAEFDDQGNYLESASGEPLADYNFSTEAGTTTGRLPFAEVESIVSGDIIYDNFNIIDTPLTPANVDDILK